ncbi:MAG: DNA-methyltransferase [Candidatus Thorarchaeota archaeon]
MQTAKTQKPSRGQKKYIPGLAAIRFKPSQDWSCKEAELLYGDGKGTIPGISYNRILFEDCITGMRKLPENSFDLVIADPPFGLDFSGKEVLYRRKSSYVVDGYEDVDSDYLRFTKDWMSELPRIMKESSTAYVYSGWTNLEPVLTAARLCGLTTINHIIWKYQFGVFTQKKFVTSHYHILMLVKNPKKYYFNKVEHYPEDVWEIPRKYRPGQVKNGTVLPTELVARCIDFSSKPGDLVLDPFMGNGTTASAAKANWRHFVGFEINKRLKPVISTNIQSVKPGEHYAPYSTRLPDDEFLRRKYPRAHSIHNGTDT